MAHLSPATPLGVALIPSHRRCTMRIALLAVSVALWGCDPTYGLGVRNQSSANYYVELISTDSVERWYEVPPNSVGWIVEEMGTPGHATLVRSDCSPVASWNQGGVIVIDAAGQAQLAARNAIDTAAKMRQILGCGGEPLQ